MNFSAVVLCGRTCSRVFCATEGIYDNAVANSQTKALDFEQQNPLRPSNIHHPTIFPLLISQPPTHLHGIKEVEYESLRHIFAAWSCYPDGSVALRDFLCHAWRGWKEDGYG